MPEVETDSHSKSQQFSG